MPDSVNEAVFGISATCGGFEDPGPDWRVQISGMVYFWGIWGGRRPSPAAVCLRQRSREELHRSCDTTSLFQNCRSHIAPFESLFHLRRPWRPRHYRNWRLENRSLTGGAAAGLPSDPRQPPPTAARGLSLLRFLDQRQVRKCARPTEPGSHPPSPVLAGEPFEAR